MSDSAWEFYYSSRGWWFWLKRMGEKEVGRSPAFVTYLQCRRDAEDHGYQRSEESTYLPAGSLSPGMTARR